MNMIEVKNLTKHFGEVIAVDSLTSHVAKGEVFGLLRPAVPVRPPPCG
jgi:ABC-type branched-subunit amino acid transport system ATPase component